MRPDVHQWKVEQATVPFSQRIERVEEADAALYIDLRTGKPFPRPPTGEEYATCLVSSVPRFEFVGRRHVRHDLHVHLTPEGRDLAGEVAIGPGGAGLKFVRRTDGSVLIESIAQSILANRYLWIGNVEDIPEPYRALVDKYATR